MLAIVLTACGAPVAGGDAEPDAGLGNEDSAAGDAASDAAPTAEAGIDGAPLDAEPRDGGIVDSALIDVGVVDADPPPPDAAALPLAPITLEAAFSRTRIMPPGRDSDAHDFLPASAREALLGSIRALGAGDLSLALMEAGRASYSLWDAGGSVALFAPPSGSGRPVIALRLGVALELLVEIPHPWFEARVRDQGLDLFTGLSARALTVSGAHRCAARATSPCSGTTSVCDSSRAPFRVTDVAHHHDTTFHDVHVELAGAYPTSVGISVHGMSGSGVSISDGTRGMVSESSLVARFFRELRRRMPDERITSCTSFMGAVVETRLCGTTNIQGRQLNGASPECTTAATTASGRFIHIEQSLAVRGMDGVLREALRSVL
jgi:hypothetical protein